MDSVGRAKISEIFLINFLCVLDVWMSRLSEHDIVFMGNQQTKSGSWFVFTDFCLASELQFIRGGSFQGEGKRQSPVERAELLRVHFSVRDLGNKIFCWESLKKRELEFFLNFHNFFPAWKFFLPLKIFKNFLEFFSNKGSF